MQVVLQTNSSTDIWTDSYNIVKFLAFSPADAFYLYCWAAHTVARYFDFHASTPLSFTLHYLAFHDRS